jgi:hypothetical protein
VHPDAYPVTASAPHVSTGPPAVSRPAVTPAPVFRPPTPEVTSPAHHRLARHHRHKPAAHTQARPTVRLPFPTFAITWFSGAAQPAVDEARHGVPARVALLLAALVLASAAFVAGAAREAVR